MAQDMIQEGRAPTSILEINAFGRPGIGSGQSLTDLAATGNAAEAPAQSGGLTGIKA
jgi:hypothetical protein